MVMDPKYTGVDDPTVNLCDTKDIFGLSNIVTLGGTPGNVLLNKLPWGNPHDGFPASFSGTSNKRDPHFGYSCAPYGIDENIEYACDKFNPFWDVYELGGSSADPIGEEGEVCGGGFSQYKDTIHQLARLDSMKEVGVNKEGFIVNSIESCNRLCKENKPCLNFGWSDAVLEGTDSSLTYDANGHNEQGKAPCMLEVSSARLGIHVTTWHSDTANNDDQGFGVELVVDYSSKGNDNVGSNEKFCAQQITSLMGNPGTFVDYPAARNAMKAHTLTECAIATGQLGGTHFSFVGPENRKSGTGKNYHLPPLNDAGKVPDGNAYFAWPSNTACPYFPGPRYNSDGSLDFDNAHPYFATNGGGQNVKVYQQTAYGEGYCIDKWSGDYGMRLTAENRPAPNTGTEYSLTDCNQACMDAGDACRGVTFRPSSYTYSSTAILSRTGECVLCSGNGNSMEAETNTLTDGGSVDGSSWIWYKKYMSTTSDVQPVEVENNVKYPI
jgi:hypothetical protein